MVPVLSWSAPATPFDARLIIVLPLPCPLLCLTQAILFLLPFRLLVCLLLGAFLTWPALVRSAPVNILVKTLLQALQSRPQVSEKLNGVMVPVYTTLLHCWRMWKWFENTWC
jgi:hypothetical protein